MAPVDRSSPSVSSQQTTGGASYRPTLAQRDTPERMNKKQDKKPTPTGSKVGKPQQFERSYLESVRSNLDRSAEASAPDVAAISVDGHHSSALAQTMQREIPDAPLKLTPTPTGKDQLSQLTPTAALPGGPTAPPSPSSAILTASALNVSCRILTIYQLFLTYDIV